MRHATVLLRVGRGELRGRPLATALGLVLVASSILAVPASAARQWLTPETVSQTLESGDQHAVRGAAMNERGDLVLAWIKRPPTVASPTVVQARYRPAGGPYGPVVTLGPANSGFAPRVAINADGRVLVTWIEGSGADRHVRGAIRAPGAGSSFDVFDVTASGSGDGFLAAGLSDDGTSFYAFERGSGVSRVIRAPSGLRVAGQLTADGIEPRLAVNGAGVAYVVWKRRVTGDGGVIEGARRLPGNGFAPLGSAVSSPLDLAFDGEVAINEAGDATVAFVSRSPGEADQVRARTYLADSGEIGEDAVGASGAFAYGVSLAVGEGRKAALVWKESFGGSDRLMAAFRGAGDSSFSAPQPLTAGASSFGEPRVIMSEFGHAVAAWQITRTPALTGTDLRTAVRVGSALGSQGFEAPETRTAPTDTLDDDPVLGIARHGDSVVAWEGGPSTTGSDARAVGFSSAIIDVPQAETPAQAVLGQAVTYTAHPVSVWSPIVEQSWTFGDGETLSGASVTKTWTALGVQTAKFRARNVAGDVGGYDTLTQVNRPPPATPTPAELFALLGEVQKAYLAPDFKLTVAPGTAVDIAPGGRVDRTISLAMTRGTLAELGRVRFEIAFVEGVLGMEARGFVFEGPQSPSDNPNFKIELRASPTIKQNATGSVTLRAVAVDHPLRPDAFVTIPVTTGAVYDPAIDAIEVTQGIQPDLPLQQKSPATYTGPDLVFGSRTSVRVFAHLTAPAKTKPVKPRVQIREVVPAAGKLGPWIDPVRFGRIENVTATPFSPEQARDNNKGVPATINLPTDVGVWTFEVVPHISPITYEARILHNTTNLASVKQCTSSACIANDNFELRKVKFTAQPKMVVRVLRTSWHDGQANHPGPSAADSTGRAFDGTRNIVPGGDLIDIQSLGDLDLNFTEGYEHQICRNFKYGINYLVPVPECVKILRTAAISKLTADFGEQRNGAVSVLAMTKGFPGVSNTGLALVDEARPYTSTAHEVGHNLGLTHHTDLICGGNDNGEEGRLETDVYGGIVGAHGFQRLGNVYSAAKLLSLRFRSGFPDPGVGFDQTLKDIIAWDAWKKDSSKSPPNAAGDRVIDFMSYCVRSDFNTWVALPVWNRMRANLAAGNVGLKSDKAAAAQLRAAAALSPVLVSAIQERDGSGVKLAAVSPVVAPPAVAGGASDVHLQTRGASGELLTDTAMQRTLLHGHPDRSSWYALSAAIPAIGARTLELRRGSQLLATQAVSASAPTVTLVSPRRGARQRRGRPLRVRWNSADADGGRLGAQVALSSDGGRTWRSVFSGANSGSVTIPATAIAASRRARVRVRITDDLHLTEAQSAIFRAEGSGPRARITDASRRVEDGQALFAAGLATDDRGRTLGSGLTWRLDGRRVGSGKLLQIQDPPAGRHRLQLVAKDYAGRTATVSRLVTVARHKPALSFFARPDSIARGARTVRFVVAALAPGTLQLGRMRVRLRERRTSVVVGVSGRGPARIPYVLRMGGSVSRGVITIARRR